MGHVPEHERDEREPGTLARSSLLLLGTLALATAFIAAYVGALHKPVPRDLPVAVVRGDAPARALLDALRRQGNEIKPVEYADPPAATLALHERRAYAVLNSNEAGNGLTLSTASAAGPPATSVISAAVTIAAQRARVPVTVTDAVPVAGGDPRGLVPFYLAVGLVLGGYLGSTALGLSVGTVPADLTRAGLRIGALAVFAVLLGTTAAIVCGPVIGVWEQHIVDLAIAGALVVFASAMATAAVQGWLGVLGTGLVVLLFVVLGNPGSGGIYPPEFLPALFRSMHRWNPPGLGADLVKSVVYFGRQGANWPIIALAIWALAGLAGLLAAVAVRSHRPARR